MNNLRRALAAIVRAVATYAHSDDPLSAASNAVALVVAFNQPFYPLYIRWLVGDDHDASFVVFYSTPFFAAVPALARASSLAGRALLPLAGVANTLASAQILGAASGVELFLAPCLIVAALSFRASERWTFLALVGVSLVAFLALHGRAGAGNTLFSPAEYASFVSLNLWSVVGLSAFAALRYSSAYEKIAENRRA